MLISDPSIKTKAMRILARWDSQVSDHSKPLRDKWVQILSKEDWDLAIEDSERGNQLRQASPLAILLPNDVRLRIIRAVKATKESLHA